MLENFFNKNIVEKKCNFFYERGFRLPAPPTGTAPLEPACFWIENPSRNRFALDGISAKNPENFLTFFIPIKKNCLKIV